MGANNQMPCDFCGAPYDPVSTRWLCPNCHMKTNCCDGAPLHSYISAIVMTQNKEGKINHEK
jgi:hypothetical protein